MEKHRCKLCLKSFANGRALGGHMRSHMMNLYVPPKSEQPPPLNDDDRDQELGLGTESVSSSDADDEEENEEKELLGYGLRENPKKSIRLVDPEFSFAVDGAGSGSVVLQDRESETESSKNPIRRRSKRIRNSGISEHHHPQCRGQGLKEPEMKKLKSEKVWKPSESPWAETEPVSSISDTTPDEDVAYCLMMLSRDKWRRNEEDYEVEPEPEPEQDESNKYYYFDEEDDQTEDDESELKQSKTRKGKYKCETCNKVFRSYQALGGHRASHKKNRAQTTTTTTTTTTIPTHEPTESQPRNAEEKIHQCPVCYRVFSSGQALGGHKRSHVTGSSSSTILPKPPSKFGPSLIDLNLPAPIDEDEISQIELSAVSDAEFVNSIKK